MENQKLLLQNNQLPFAIIWKEKKYYVDWDLYYKAIKFKEERMNKYAAEMFGFGHGK